MSLNLTSNDHIQGIEDASVELIEYADYQCPYCKKAYYIVREAQKVLGSQLKLVFRNFPLEDLHPFALQAAVASEIAATHGKFWEMHDMLLENQRNLDTQSLMRYAEEIGLNADKFKKEFGNPQYFDKVKADVDSGIENGVEGTPTFFINGKLFEGNWMDAEFIDYLNSLTRSDNS